jgi:hypothetical protein
MITFKPHHPKREKHFPRLGWASLYELKEGGYMMLIGDYEGPDVYILKTLKECKEVYTERQTPYFSMLYEELEYD